MKCPLKRTKGGVQFIGHDSHSRGFLIPGGAALILTALLLAIRAAHAQTTPNFVNLNTWPLDGENHYIIAFPDSAWTWQRLGLNPGYACPPYYQRSRQAAPQYWRDPSIPEDVDWAQATLDGLYVGCYSDHRGTDIAAPPGAPVYAAADGTITLTEAGSDEKGDDGQVIIAHHRTVDGVEYAWQVRYVHLKNVFPVTSGPVREGQLIGYVANRGTNTHLHFAVEGLWDCWLPCIQNPWGPVYLWIDDDFDGFPDPAPSILAHAPPDQALLTNGDFALGMRRWLPTAGASAQVEQGALHFYRRAASGWAAVEQIIPYAADAGSPFEITLRLGNSSDATKYVGVSLRDVHGWSGYVGCAFVLPPGAPLATYTVRGKSGGDWANFVLSISANPADGLAAVVVDDVTVTYQPTLGVSGTVCEGP